MITEMKSNIIASPNYQMRKSVNPSDQTILSTQTTHAQLLPCTAKYLSSFRNISFGLARKALPAAPKDSRVVEDFHGCKIADPFRPLEDLDAPQTIKWWKAQNKRTESYLAGANADRLEAIKWHEEIRNYTRDTIQSKYGDNYFFIRRAGLDPQLTYYVRKGAKNAKSQILIDPNKLSNDGTVALGSVDVSPNGKLVAYTISKKGSDMQTMFFRDVETGEDFYEKLEDLYLTDATWDVDGKGVIYTKLILAEGAEGYNVVIYHHTLGEDQSKDVQVYKRPDIENAIVGAFRTKKDDEVLFIYVMSGAVPQNGVYFLKPGESRPKKILPPNKAELAPFYRNGNTLYATTDLNAPRTRIVSIDLNNPDPSNWKTIVPENKDTGTKLKNAFIADGKLLVFWSKGGADAMEIRTMKGKHIADVNIPLGSIINTGKVNPEEKEFEMSIGGFLSPGRRYKYNVSDNKLTFVKKSNISRDLTDIAEVERIYAASKDGTKVPMWIIKPKNMPKDGTAATLLEGYGGFNTSLEPEFSFDIMHWVENGGVWAVANVRGDGEFGTSWHDGGRLKNKQNSFDDFAACAEKLVKDKYTKPERLAIYGKSNGGLLTAVVSQQYPDHFGAVISDVPVTDMIRFNSSWISEYGDPDKKKDFETLIKYSPLHNVQSAKKVKYPPTLIMSAEFDDRVAPWHSFKWVATRQEKGHQDNTYLRVDEDAGHGAGKPIQKIIENSADRYAFLVRTLGPIRPKTQSKS